MLPSLPSIPDSQTLMRRGKLRPIDLVEHCLGRIHQFEDQIHARYPKIKVVQPMPGQSVEV